MRKLFLVTRADLPDGQQAVQAAHALQEFNVKHPKIAHAWYQESNTLAFLTVPDEAALGALLKKATRRDIPAVFFHEPDRNNEMTAIALGSSAQSLVSKLPLALPPVYTRSNGLAPSSLTDRSRAEDRNVPNMRSGGADQVSQISWPMDLQEQGETAHETGVSCQMEEDQGRFR